MWRLTPRDYPGDPSFSLVLQGEPYSLGRFSECSIVIRSAFTGVSKKQGSFKVKLDDDQKEDEDEENPRETEDQSKALSLYYTDTSTRGAVIRGKWVSKTDNALETKISSGDVISLGSRIPPYPDEKDLCYAFIATFEKGSSAKPLSSNAVNTSIPFSPVQDRVSRSKPSSSS